jgi:regulator of RNase E activity RraA
MAGDSLPAELWKQLESFDTPTICNALEQVAPERRARGFTTRPLVCAWPDLPPVIGYARTATIRAREPSMRAPAEQARVQDAYYAYVAEGGPRPSICVIQDLDDHDAGFGAFWGEVHTHVHRGLGSRGVVTNGSIRDLPVCAQGFQLLAAQVGPSHAHVHVVDFGMPVQVCGMATSSGDLVHMDRHGAVVIPHEAAAAIPAAAASIARREARIIEAAKRPDFSLEQLRSALRASRELH